MKEQGRKSPAVHTEISGSGKKLVQARLPFKILSSPVPAPMVMIPNSEVRKRKLSSEGNVTGPRKVLCTSETKENLGDCKDDPVVVLSDDEATEPAVDGKTSPNSLNPVVKLSKIDDLIKDLTNEDGRIMLSPKTPKGLKGFDVVRLLDSPTSSRGTTTGTKLHIKLPISEKKKRKLSQKLSSSMEEDSDIELISEESQKKSKHDNKDVPKNAAENCQTLNDEKSKNPCIAPREDQSQKSLDTLDNLKEVDKDSSDKDDTVEVSLVTDDEDSLEPSSAKDVNAEENRKPAESTTDEPHSEDDSVHIEDDSDVEMSSAKSSQPIKSDNECAINGTPSKTSEDTNPQGKVLTPRQRKQIDTRKDKEKQKEAERLAKQKEKEEKLRSRQKEKEEKEEQRRKEKEEKEEQKRKEKEEKEDQKRKEKEEKEKKRLAELEAKNEERRQKEEERRKKEDDKRRKEEEAESKKRRAAAAFSKFFVQSKAPPKDPDNDENSSDGSKIQKSNFVPFQIKRDMKLAPICRKWLDGDSKTKLDEILQREKAVPAKDLYLSCLKAGRICPGKDTRTLPACSIEEDNPADCILIVDELEGAGLEIDEANKPIQKYRAKFLYFHENQRPPYYGTWRKKSKSVKPRRPFSQDTILFDYEVDSDDEWEEEDPGESLHGSDDEKESEDEYDVDNEFMVPHGHLSDEELQNEEEEDNSPEMQKEKLKLLQAEFAQEMKKKTEKIKPRIVGIVWQDGNGNRPDLCSNAMWESLNKRAMIFTDPPIVKPPVKAERESVTPEKKQPLKNPKLTEEHIKSLVQLVHGNRHKKDFMIKEFQAFVSKETPETEQPLIFKKSSIREQIERIAAWKVMVMDGVKNKKRLCWMVTPDILKQYDLEELGIVNKWAYTLQPKRVLEETEKPPETEVNTKPVEKEDLKSLKKKKRKKSHPEITMFTTVLSKEDGKSSSTLNVTSSSDTPLENNNKESASKPLQLKEKSDEVLKPIPDNANTSTKSPILSSKYPPNQATQKTPVQRKRVPLLMSVSRGQAIPQEKKNALISEFLKKRPGTEKDLPDTKATSVGAPETINLESDDDSLSEEPVVVTPAHTPIVSSKPSLTPPQKKRVSILMSVPRGQEIPQETKSALISEFLKKRPETDKDPPGNKETSIATSMEVETITLD